MKRVLIINQSSELYGSDKVVLQLLLDFPDGYSPIVVVEGDGPLVDILNKKGIPVLFSPVLKIKRDDWGLLFPFRFLFKTIRSVFALRSHLKGLKIDLVHSNSITVFLGAFYAAMFRIPHLWHVHEIVEHPAAAAKYYPKIVSFFSRLVIFNSKATASQFRRYAPATIGKSRLIYNGQERKVPFYGKKARAISRKTLFGVSDDEVIIGLVGRISRLKGQKVLLDAFCKLAPSQPNVILAFIGSPPDGQEHFLDNLCESIAASGLAHRIRVLGFQSNVWDVYDALDIIVVPSTEPESFGLVATEAMLSHKPVVASAIGGLAEIVVDGETGFLVTPSDPDALATALSRLTETESIRNKMGNAGKKRVAEVFSAKRFRNDFQKTYDSLI